MKTYTNYKETVAATGEGFEQVKLGGTILKILRVKCEEKQYGELFTIEFDIEEGEQKGFFKKQFDSEVERVGIEKAKWRGVYWQTVIEDKLQFFKGFITAIEKSNQGYKWNDEKPDENELVGKLFGGVFGEQEFKANDGTVKVSTKVVQIRSVDEIRKGVKVPEIKRLAGYSQEKAAFEALAGDVDDLPF